MCLCPSYAKFGSVEQPNGSRQLIFVSAEKRFESDTFVIPCGKCDECRLDKAREWSVRCQLEASLYDHNYFVTLTYDDDHLPDSFVVPGTHLEVNTLVPDHFKQFLKSLRQFYKRKYGHDGIRFFGCGEYGTKSMRPHYHLIIFNLPIYDLKPYKKSNGKQLFISEELHHIWGKGYVVVGEVTPQSCGYVARYNYKKQIQPLIIDGLVPEFVRCSRMPGIGFEYFRRNYDHLCDVDFEVILNGKKYPILDYFARMLRGHDLDKLKEIKDKIRRGVVMSDRSILDINFVRSNYERSYKRKLLTKDNITLDTGDILLYNNRVD